MSRTGKSRFDYDSAGGQPGTRAAPNTVRNRKPSTKGKDEMPSQPHADQPHKGQPGSETPGPAQHVSPPSRRSVLRGAAGAGAAGLAAAAGAGALLGTTASAAAGSTTARSTTEGTAAASTQSADAGEQPLVIYLKDAATGEFEVFSGTGQVRLTSPRLAAELRSSLKHTEVR
jgi:hypothetical protein